MVIKLFGLVFGIALGIICEAANPSPIKIGILDTIDPWFYVQTFEPTMEHLRDKLPGRRIETEELSFDELQSAVTQGRLDFFIAPSGFFSFVSESSGARHIATRHRQLASQPGSSVGSVFVVRSDDTRFHQLKDLKNTTVVATSQNSFDGWITAMGELHKITNDVDRFFASHLFVGYGLPDVATIVSNHGADVGILKACELEMLENDGSIRPGTLRVINEKNNKQLNCRVSTDLYPDVVFASLPKASSNLIKDVSVVLLTMPETSGGDSWSIANDFSTVAKLYKNLRLGPYEYLRETTISALFQRYRIEFFIVLGVLALILLYIISVNRIVLIRTHELHEALNERNKAEVRARKSQEQLFQLEKAGIVTGLSSMFAHEAQQPISSMLNYAEGLKMYLASHPKDKLMEEAVTEIAKQSQRLALIINRVRSYAKQSERLHVSTDLNLVLDRAINTFKRSSNANGVKLHCQTEKPALVDIDPLEIELLLVNILRNAGTALRSKSEKCIDVSLSSSDSFWVLSVADNGEYITDETLTTLSKPTVSLSKEGLGLGLSICKVIAEAHGGSIHFQRNEPFGLIAVIHLPKQEKRRAPNAQQASAASSNY